jgi:hypothetical protein
MMPDPVPPEFAPVTLIVTTLGDALAATAVIWVALLGLVTVMFAAPVVGLALDEVLWVAA